MLNLSYQKNKSWIFSRAYFGFLVVLLLSLITNSSHLTFEVE